MDETWIPAVGFGADVYEVSDQGRVRSVDRLASNGRRYRGQVRKLHQRGNGYLYVNLRVDGIGRLTPVHKLVCEAFHGPKPEPKAEVRHLTGDPLNNRASNLRWGSRADNMADRVTHGVSNRGERHGQHKLTADQVRAIRADPRPRWAVAQTYGIDRRYVSTILNRTTWSWLPAA